MILSDDLHKVSDQEYLFISLELRFGARGLEIPRTREATFLFFSFFSLFILF